MRPMRSPRITLTDEVADDRPAVERLGDALGLEDHLAAARADLGLQTDRPDLRTPRRAFFPHREQRAHAPFISASAVP